MKIAIAPSDFKGSLSAREACRAIEKGAQRALPAVECINIPLADGGEGTLGALLSAGPGGKIKSQIVRGPLGNPVNANWGILPDGRAVIEMAQACGLGLISGSERDALAACSFGLGQLIKSALDAGCRSIWIGLGDSASTDGGVGALNALGLHARDARQRALPPGGGALINLDDIDLRFFDKRIAKCDITLLCDVVNPLHGPQGAARIYSAQKGASEEEIKLLDDGLRHYGEVTTALLGTDNVHRAGAGAAGGVGFGLMAFCGAQMRLGIDAVLEATQFADKITGADLILIGEGGLDAQALSGKTIVSVCNVARDQQIPVIALTGSVELSCTQTNELGLKQAFSISDHPHDLFRARNAAELLASRAEQIVKSWYDNADSSS